MHENFFEKTGGHTPGGALNWFVLKRTFRFVRWYTAFAKVKKRGPKTGIFGVSEVLTNQKRGNQLQKRGLFQKTGKWHQKTGNRRRRLHMRNDKNHSGRCTKQTFSKHPGICRTYSPIQLAYAEQLEADPGVKERNLAKVLPLIHNYADADTTKTIINLIGC